MPLHENPIPTPVSPQDGSPKDDGQAQEDVPSVRTAVLLVNHQLFPGSLILQPH